MPGAPRPPCCHALPCRRCRRMRPPAWRASRWVARRVGGSHQLLQIVMQCCGPTCQPLAAITSPACTASCHSLHSVCDVTAPAGGGGRGAQRDGRQAGAPRPVPRPLHGGPLRCAELCCAAQSMPCFWLAAMHTSVLEPSCLLSAMLPWHGRSLHRCCRCGALSWVWRVRPPWWRLWVSRARGPCDHCARNMVANE